MVKVTLTSRDAEKKRSLASLEVLLLFGLAIIVFLGIWALGSRVTEQNQAAQGTYEHGLDELSDSF